MYMFFVERFLFILIGIALIGAGGFGAALYYHFSRFSPDQSVTTKTMIVYGAGVAVIAIFSLVIMLMAY